MTDLSPHLQTYLDMLFAHGPFWAYLILFAASFIENLFPPFPGDSFVVAGGGLVALGRLSYLPTVAAVIAGGMCSVILLYLVGRRYGREYFIRKNFRYFNVDDLHRMEQRLTKWGALILIGSRFVVGVRSVLALASGIAEYPLGKLVLFSTISYVAFVALLMTLAAKLVSNFDVIEEYFRAYNQVIWPILIVMALIWLWSKVRKTRKRGSA